MNKYRRHQLYAMAKQCALIRRQIMRTEYLLATRLTSRGPEVRARYIKEKIQLQGLLHAINGTAKCCGII